MNGNIDPELVAPLEGFLAAFGNIRTIHHAYLFVSRGHNFCNQLFIKINKTKGLAKLTRIGLFTQITVTAHIPKIDSAAHQQNRQKQGHQKFLLWFGYT